MTIFTFYITVLIIFSCNSYAVIKGEADVIVAGYAFDEIYSVNLNIKTDIEKKKYFQEPDHLVIS